MRTTVRLDDEVMVEVKQHAARTRRSVTQLIREALVAQLERERGTASPRRVRLPVFGGDGVCDGVDLNSSASLLDRLEKRK